MSKSPKLFKKIPSSKRGKDIAPWAKDKIVKDLVNPSESLERETKYYRLVKIDQKQSRSDYKIKSFNSEKCNYIISISQICGDESECKEAQDLEETILKDRQ